LCGIAGYYGPEIIDPRRIGAALQLMGRRGPDHADSRHWITAVGQNCYLLHSRLSIIDLDPRANQPFSVGSKWIALNGELYNYVERRQELQSLGHSFRTQSDTEVLLKTIDHFGWSALDKCEGMWAFAVYDETDGSLTLCRDRFGEKPLYLYRDGGGLYFGSEVKFIAALLGRRLEINYEQVFRYLVNGYRALYKAGDTYFKDLSELPSASTLRIDAAGLGRPKQYWTPRFDTDESMTYDEAVSGVKERLIRSVELRLRADVPLAFYLSGGIDSNSMISIAKRVFDYDVHGFTIMNTDERYEERDMVEHSVSQLGIRHTPVPVDTTDFLPRMRTLVAQHDAPVCTVNYFANWLLMDQIHQHGYRVAISGSAADEIFSGYYDHHLFYLNDVRSLPEMFAQSLGLWEQHVKPLVRNQFLRDPNLFFANPDFRGHIFMNSEEFSEYLFRPWAEPFAEQRYCESLLRNRMLNEMFHEAVPIYLHEEDLNAMYFSIENRSPYLDRDLFEFCSIIPTKHLVQNGRAKAVLRSAMRGIAPDLILDNFRKVGFNAPIYSYLDVDDPAVRGYLLNDSPIFEYVRRERIEQLITVKDLPNSVSKFLFSFVSSKMFLELFS